MSKSLHEFGTDDSRRAHRHQKRRSGKLSRSARRSRRYRRFPFCVSRSGEDRRKHQGCSESRAAELADYADNLRSNPTTSSTATIGEPASRSRFATVVGCQEFGELVEFPYSVDDSTAGLVAGYFPCRTARGRLKRLLEMKPLVRVLEAHSGITGPSEDHGA